MNKAELIKEVLRKHQGFDGNYGSGTSIDSEYFDDVVSDILEVLQGECEDCGATKLEDGRCPIDHDRIKPQEEKELLLKFKNWEVDNDISQLLPEQLVDFYLEEQQLKE